MSNVDPAEIAKFDRLAARWWDRDGELRPLHDMNAGRMAYLREHVQLSGATVIDVGCGGGLLSEALVREGARATGIDASTDALASAREHARVGALEITYVEATAEAFAQSHPGRFDVVTCMELIEHVPDPAALARACVTLARPGAELFFATLNRTARAYLLAVLGAEYCLRLLPRGTHDYARFVRPSELAAWLRAAGAEITDVTGLHYNPFTRHCRTTRDTAVNYILHARTPDS